MVLRKLAVALLSVGVMLPGLGHALAVKDIQTKSALGEPYLGEVELTDLGDLNADEIKVSLATQEDFERLGIERVYFLSDLRFDVIVNQAGRSYVKVTTSKAVREPFLDFVVRVAWPGNVRLQNVTALLDPPVASSSTASSVNQPVTTAPATAPVVAKPVAPAPTTAPAPVVAQPTKPVPQTQPVPKPQPTVQATPAAVKATAEGEYRVQAGDTLSRIVASQVGSSVGTAQAMIAIQKANPQAFNNGNINQLRRGQVLRIPSDAEIREVNAREAIASVRAQSSSWKAATAPEALTSQQVDATAKQEKPSATVAPTPKPEMKLLGAQAGKQAGTPTAGSEAGSAADATKLKQSQVKTNAAKADKEKLTAEVGKLDAAVKANDKQIAVQNAKLAELNAQLKAEADKKAAAEKAAAEQKALADKKAAAEQKALADKKAADEKALADKAAADKAGAEQKAAADAANAPAGTAEGVETKAAETAADIQSAPIAEEKPATPTPAVVQEEAPEESGVSLPLLAGGAAGLLALLGGAFWWRKRRQEEEEAAAMAELDAMDDEFSDDSAQGLFADDQAALTEDAGWDLDNAEVAQERVLADPLEEVEQYLAFERYPQAIGFLNKAIEANPDRGDLRLKLMEVYAKVDDWNGFVEQEAWFENAGDLDALARAEELKVGLTPPVRKPSADDALEYHKPELAESEGQNADDMLSLEDLEMDFNASVSASSPALQAVQDSELSLDSSLDLDTELNLDSDFSLDTPSQEATEPAADSGLSLDEDLDFSFESKPESTPASETDDFSFELDAEPENIQVETTAADEGMDFSLDADLDFDAPAKADASAGLGELVDFDEAPELKVPEVQTTEDDLSFSLDDLEAEAAADLDIEASAELGDLEGDFNLDDNTATDLAFDQTAITDSGLSNAAADFDSTLRMDAEPAEELIQVETIMPAAAAPAPAADLDDEFDFLADSDENATKLDLARAYIDMGDMEGARDILQEVLNEGSEAQREEAKNLLAQAG